MSEVAGRLASQVGAEVLGTGVISRGMLGGVPGTPPAKVVIIGAGVSGAAALEVPLGLRANVTILDRDLDKMRQIDRLFDNQVGALASTATTVEREVLAADVVIGAVLVVGARAPKLVTRALVAPMKQGSVLVDIAIDQGVASRTPDPPATGSPRPGCTPRSSTASRTCPARCPTPTIELTNATAPYARALADNGRRRALRDDAGLAEGLSTCNGQLASAPVGAAHGIATEPLATRSGVTRTLHHHPPGAPHDHPHRHLTGRRPRRHGDSRRRPPLDALRPPGPSPADARPGHHPW